jgi:putative membrane protein
MFLRRNEKKMRIALYFTILVYISGMIGMNTSWRPWFVDMTPFSLLLSAGVLLWWQPVHTPLTRAWAIGAVLVGFFAEVIGVNTGLLFGEYQYGDALGFKIASTPLMIGVNWLMVTLIVNELVWRVLPARTPLFVGGLLGAVGCTLYDWFIEPGAIGLGYWTWAEGVPPAENYFGWFVVSFIISLSYARQMTPVLRNTAAPVILALQILFFWAIR